MGMKLKFLCVELLMKMRKIHCMSTEVIVFMAKLWLAFPVRF
jgi:hypothetical protein